MITSWLTMVGLGLCAVSVTVFFGLVGAVIWQGERAQVGAGFVYAPAAPISGLRDVPEYDRKQRRKYQRLLPSRTRVLNVLLIVLLVVAFCCSVLWLAAFGLESLVNSLVRHRH